VSRNPTLCCAALGSAPGCVIATPTKSLRDFVGTPAVLGSDSATALVLRLASRRPTAARNEQGSRDTPLPRNAQVTGNRSRIDGSPFAASAPQAADSVYALIVSATFPATSRFSSLLSAFGMASHGISSASCGSSLPSATRSARKRRSRANGSGA
jgi:hypothetical protein